jgi:hypothetical protein
VNYRIVLFLGTIAGVAVFWFVATDLVYCFGSMRFDMFDWPFTLWFEDFPSRNYSFIQRLRWWGAPILPTLLIGRLLWQTRMHLWPRFAGLYGDSRPASWWDMRRSGIRHRRTPF